MHKVEVASNDIMPIPYFVKIGLLTEKLKERAHTHSMMFLYA
jgi:hypothetical protein